MSFIYIYICTSVCVIVTMYMFILLIFLHVNVYEQMKNILFIYFNKNREAWSRLYNRDEKGFILNSKVRWISSSELRPHPPHPTSFLIWTNRFSRVEMFPSCLWQQFLRLRKKTLFIKIHTSIKRSFQLFFFCFVIL